MEKQKKILQVLEQEPKKWLQAFIAITIIASMSWWSFSTINFRGINPIGLNIARSVARAFIAPNQD